jgi:hypothetical protein
MPHTPTRSGTDPFNINPNPMAIKKCVAVRLEIIYDYQATNRKQGGLPVRVPSPCHTPFSHLDVIYDSQLAQIHKNTTTKRWKLFLFEEKLPKTALKKKLEQDLILKHFVRNRSRIKNMFTSGHFE